MVLGVIACKGLVSLIASRTFHYNGSQTVMMWSLAMPQVAATLATAFIGYEADSSIARCSIRCSR